MKHLNKQDGFSTLMLTMIGGVMSLSVGTTVLMMDKRKTYLEVVRMQNRMELSQAEVVGAASSLGALRASAKRASGNSLLTQCVLNKSCRDMDDYRAYTLYDSGARQVSGLRDLSGKVCKENCPIRIKTEYQISCGAGASTCSTPAEVRTRYVVSKGKSDHFGGRAFDDITGFASAAAFVCPDGEYVYSISDDGQIFCSPANGNLNASICPGDTVAAELDSNGLLTCTPVVDYCEQPVAFSYVLDVSRSMNDGDKIGGAKSSAEDLLKKLKNGDRAQLTTYSTFADNKTGLEKNKGRVISVLKQQRASGWTNMTAGLRLGAKNLEGLKGDRRVIVFLSDGHHNRGDIDPIQQAELVKRDGIRIFTIGFGSGVDVQRLRRMASSPNDYFFAGSKRDLKLIFKQLATNICR